MTYKSVSTLFLAFNLIAISKGYTDTCPALSANQLKQIVVGAAKNKEDDFTQNQFSGVSINGEIYNTRYSPRLERAFSSEALANTDNMKVESLHLNSNEHRFNTYRGERPMTMHICDYTISETAYHPLPEMPEVQIYTVKPMPY